MLVHQLFSIGFLIETIAFNLTKFMGIFRYRNQKLARRIDIIWVSQDSYICSLLYFTGSDIFNRIFRTVALKSGFSLNNYGLYPILEKNPDKHESNIVNPIKLKDYKAPKKYLTGSKIPVKSEKEVFHI